MRGNSNHLSKDRSIVFTIIIVLFLLLISLNYVYAENVTSINDIEVVMDNKFNLNESITVDIVPEDYRNVDLTNVIELWINYQDNNYKYFGDVIFPLSISFQKMGLYTLSLISKMDYSEITSQNFTLGSVEENEAISIEPDYSYLNYDYSVLSEIVRINNPFGNIVNKLGFLKPSFRGPLNVLNKPTPSIKSIFFSDANPNKPLELGLDEISTPISVNDIRGVKSFAIDPTQADFSEAIVTSEAKGNMLFMCKDYNFSTRDCYGSWERVRDITPGEEYTFMISPEDPLFTETNSTFSCSCVDAVTNSDDATISCETYCSFTIDIPENATEYFLEEITYNLTFNMIASGGFSSSSGSQFGIFDHDTNKNDGDEITIGNTAYATTTSYSITNNSIPASGSQSFTDLDCDNWPSHCNYEVYINTTFSFVTPGNSRRDASINLSIDSIQYILNYSLPGAFNVLLDSPDNNFNSNDTSVTFGYIPSNSPNSIDNCSIYTNETTWSVKNTDTTIINGSTNYIDVNFTSDGTYTWNVECFDIGTSIFAASNRTIIIDTTAPEITLINPADAYNETTSGIIDFTFNVTDINSLDNCSLNVDSAPAKTLSSPSKVAINTITHSLTNGDYNWSITCWDEAGNFNTTNERTLKINITPTINNGTWYKTSTSDCTTTPCDISLAQDVDGTQNTVSEDVPASQTITAVRAISINMGGNGVEINGTRQVVFSSFFTASDGNLDATWYLYKRDISNSDTLLCSDTAGTAVTAGAASTGTCTLASDTYINSSDSLYLRMDVTNGHPNQLRSFTHAVDQTSSYVDITNFVQLGYLSSSLIAPPNNSVYNQSETFNITCNVTCDFASCLDINVYAQTNQSGSWQNVASSGTIQLAGAQSNPSALGYLFNSSSSVSLTLNGSTPGSSNLRCYADSKYNDAYSGTIDVDIGATNPPIINLTLPGNNSWVKDNPLTLTYIPSTFATLDFCELYIDGNLNDTDNSPTANVENSFNITGLSQVRHNWSVSCTDVGSLSGNSSTYYFEFDSNAPSNITVYSPFNNSVLSVNQINFNFSVEDARSDNMSCDLYIDSSLNTTIVAQNNTPTSTIISDFSLGNHSWYLTCTDLAGNSLTSGNYNFTIQDVPPNITLVDPANNTGVNTSLATLTYFPDDGFGLDTCSLYVNGTFNQSNSSVLNAQNNTFEITITESQYAWFVRCNDTNGNYKNSSGFTFFGDFTPPNIQLDSPANNTNFTNSFVTFLYTPSDNWNDLTCTLNINGTANITDTAVSGIQESKPLSSFADGDYNWDVSCMDIGNNTNVSENRLFKINESPSFVLDYPPNETFFNISNPVINYTVSDNDGLNVCEFYLDGVLNQTNNSVVSGLQQSIALTSQSEGSHYWSSYCEDLGVFNNTIQTGNYTFIIDLTDPNVSLLDPVPDQVIRNVSYNFSWSTFDNLADNLTCDLYINDVINVSGIFVNNNSVASQNVSGFVTGDYNWTVNCFDLAGNLQSQSQNFSVVIPPDVTLTSPGNGTSDLVRNVSFNYVPSGGSGTFLNCSIYLNGVLNQTNYSITPDVGNNFNLTNLPDGEYDWNVECFDTNNESSFAENNFTYYVDTESPYQIDLFSPLNDSVQGVNNVSFTFAAYDAVSPSMSCDVYLNDTTSVFPIASSLNALSGENVTTYYLMSDGNYSWYVDCTDNSGLFNVSDENFFEVIAPPNVTLQSPGNDTWLNVTNVDLIYLPEDDYQIVSCDLYLNGVLNDTDGVVLKNKNNTFPLTNLPQGEYNWTVACQDNDFNEVRPVNDTFYVDLTSPNIQLNSPSEGEAISGIDVFLNWTVTDNLAPQLTCDLYINDTIESANITVNNSEPYVYQTSSLSDGDYNWSVFCYDLINNSNVSETRNFTIPIADISVVSNEIFFSEESPSEGTIINITATVRNVGGRNSEDFTVEFWDNAVSEIIESPIYVNGLTIGESINLTVSYNTSLGSSEILVATDVDNNITEANETNNNATKTITVGFWHYATGTMNDSLRITDASYGLLFDWASSDTVGSNIYVTDPGSSIDWSKLQALGRSVGGTERLEDFEILDVQLNSTDFFDSINNTFTRNGNLVENATYRIFGNNISNIPVVNSTNNTNFKTGILWDYTDTPSDYNGTQDVLFVTTLNRNSPGYMGIVDFEIRIPATLREYISVGNDKVVFYTELT